MDTPVSEHYRLVLANLGCCDKISRVMIRFEPRFFSFTEWRFDPDF
jgi:hypothetical protein